MMLMQKWRLPRGLVGVAIRAKQRIASERILQLANMLEVIKYVFHLQAFVCYR